MSAGELTQEAARLGAEQLVNNRGDLLTELQNLEKEG